MFTRNESGTISSWSGPTPLKKMEDGRIVDMPVSELPDEVGLRDFWESALFVPCQATIIGTGLDRVFVHDRDYFNALSTLSIMRKMYRESIPAVDFVDCDYQHRFNDHWYRDEAGCVNWKADPNNYNWLVWQALCP